LDRVAPSSPGEIPEKRSRFSISDIDDVTDDIDTDVDSKFKISDIQADTDNLSPEEIKELLTELEGVKGKESIEEGDVTEKFKVFDRKTREHVLTIIFNRSESGVYSDIDLQLPNNATAISRLAYEIIENDMNRFIGYMNKFGSRIGGHDYKFFDFLIPFMKKYTDELKKKYGLSISWVVNKNRSSEWITDNRKFKFDMLSSEMIQFLSNFERNNYLVSINDLYNIFISSGFETYSLYDISSQWLILNKKGFNSNEI